MTNKENQEFVFYSDKLNYKTVDGAKGKEYFIEGHISTGDIDLVNDIVTKSCMDDMTNQFDGRSIKLDFEHETFRGKTALDAEANKTRLPLGKAVNKSRDEKGVKVKWQMNPTWKKFDEKGNVTMTFKDIWTNIESGMYDAFSIAYVPTRTTNVQQEGKSVRMLDRVNLLNVALTGNPINPMATMSSVMAKSLEFMKDQEANELDNVEIKDTELKYKYIKRTGGPGNYIYTYPDGSTSKNPNKKKTGSMESGDRKLIGGIDEKIHEKIDELPNIVDDVTTSDLQGITSAIASDILGNPKTKEERQVHSELDDKLIEFANGDVSKAEVADAIKEAKKPKKESGSAKNTLSNSGFNIDKNNSVSGDRGKDKEFAKKYYDFLDKAKSSGAVIKQDSDPLKNAFSVKFDDGTEVYIDSPTGKYGSTTKVNMTVIESKKPKKKSVDELFNRAQELNLTVGMADRLLKSNLSDNIVDNKNMGYKQMVDEKKPVVDAEAPETPVESGKEETTPVVEKPVEESKPEGKSMTLTELKSIVEVLVKDIDVLKKENADLKAIVEKPLQKAIGAEKKQDHGAEAKGFNGPIDLIR